MTKKQHSFEMGKCTYCKKKVCRIWNGISCLSAAFAIAAFAVSGIVIVMVAIFAVDWQVNLSLKEQLHTIQAESFKSRELEWRKVSAFIEPVDLCCILGNAFDNAIAACNRMEDGKKWITARGFIKQGQLVIAIKNSKPPYVAVVNGKVFPKEITVDHGLGLETVKTVVEKYGGILHLSADDAFSFSVLLPPLRL